MADVSFNQSYNVLTVIFPRGRRTFFSDMHAMVIPIRYSKLKLVSKLVAGKQAVLLQI
jgi:hypothetical protein